MEKQKKISISLSIPESIQKELGEEAERTGTSVSKVAIYRMQHHKSVLTPAVIAKIQNIVNIATDMTNANTEATKNLQERVNELWKFVK